MRMKSSKLVAASLACLGTLVSPLSAAPTGGISPRDVVLQEGNVLVGQVVDPQGVSKPNTVVSVTNHQAEIAFGECALGLFVLGVSASQSPDAVAQSLSG